MRVQPEVYIEMPFGVGFIIPVDDIPVCALQIVLITDPMHADVGHWRNILDDLVPIGGKTKSNFVDYAILPLFQAFNKRGEFAAVGEQVFEYFCPGLFC